jgi:AraC-like DNA-binding protein
MRRGSVSERTMKCGQPGCPCQQDPKARHGPYYSLTRPVAGKTQSRYLNREQAELAKQQIEEGHKFRQQLEHYWAACEQWADAQLEGSQAAATEAAKKKGFPRSSKAKSAKKSKPS